MGGNVLYNILIDSQKVPRNRIWETAAIFKFWNVCYIFWGGKASFISQIQCFGLIYVDNIYLKSLRYSKYT